MLSRARDRCEHDQTDDPAADDDRQRALQLERFDLQVLGLVDAEQHDDEQEQHHDRAGVDDDLHGRQEVGVLGDEQHGDTEQREDQAERGMNRMRARRSTPISTGQAPSARADEDEQLHQRRASPRVGSRTP